MIGQMLTYGNDLTNVFKKDRKYNIPSKERLIMKESEAFFTLSYSNGPIHNTRYKKKVILMKLRVYEYFFLKNSNQNLKNRIIFFILFPQAYHF